MSASSSIPVSRESGQVWLVAVVAAGAVVGALLHAGGPTDSWLWLHWLCKPLVTALIFVLAWRAQSVVSPRYRRWILAGIACSLAGDVLLMLPQDRSESTRLNSSH